MFDGGTVFTADTAQFLAGGKKAPLSCTLQTRILSTRLDTPIGNVQVFFYSNGLFGSHWPALLRAPKFALWFMPTTLWSAHLGSLTYGAVVRKANAGSQSPSMRVLFGSRHSCELRIADNYVSTGGILPTCIDSRLKANPKGIFVAAVVRFLVREPRP